MIRTTPLKWPISLAIVLSVLIVALLVFWIISQVASGHWGLLTVGIVLFVLVLIGVATYLVLTIKEIQINRRQGNFIASVTHELKSPLASIKLYLQTLELRDVGPEQQREFHRFMLEDIQRLDQLIDHLLQAARVEEAEPDGELEDVDADAVLQECVAVTRRRYTLSEEQIRLEVHPCQFRGRKRDLEMIFGNLLDNAAKYAGSPAQIQVQAHPQGSHRVLVRISDNGRGIRFEMRRKVFQRFFRGGTELERTTTGTGLGLFIVKSLVRKYKGRINVHGRGPLKGATFDVELPGRAITNEFEPSSSEKNGSREPPLTPASRLENPRHSP